MNSKQWRANKPTILYKSGRWICYGRTSYGEGTSPMAAYLEWSQVVRLLRNRGHWI